MSNLKKEASQKSPPIELSKGLDSKEMGDRACIFGCYLTFTCVHAQPFSHAQLFATLWTVAHEVLLSMGFPRQDY